LAQRADPFRRSDVVLWGSVAVVASALALVAANMAALEPQGALAMLHNSRAGAAQASELTAELAALHNSKSKLAELTDLQQQVQTSQQQLTAARQQVSAIEDRLQQSQQQASRSADALGVRLAALEKAVAANGTQLSALAGTTPRKVNALSFEESDPTTITGAIDAPVAGFTGATPPIEPRVQPMPTALPAAETDLAGPKWTDVAALPAFASPAEAVATDGIAPGEITPAEATSPDTLVPYPMAPRPATLDRPAAAPLALEADTGPDSTAVAPAEAPPKEAPGAIGSPPARRPKADVRAIGVAVGNPVTPAAALASWQQIAEKVGVLLVGTSPLLAADPAGSAGKVLVAGPIPSIAAATALCGKIEAAALSCMPMPYVGAALGGEQ
jgi:hypothetical protein